MTKTVSKRMAEAMQILAALGLPRAQQNERSALVSRRQTRSCFPGRAVMARYLAVIAWETEVWIAEAPSHLIHFDGERFLGPYTVEKE